jgi:sortase (surface protein transpeptidase)
VGRHQKRRRFASQAASDRFVRRRKILFRSTLVGANVLAIVLAVLGIGAYGTLPPSYERLLPAPSPSSSGIDVPRTVQDGSPTKVDLSGTYVTTNVPQPTELRIPAIGVDAPVVPLGRNPDGTAQVPATVSLAGWYDLGPKPGQLGPAVILGHVDSRTGPGIFYRLRSLLPGDVVTVLSGSQVLHFVVSHLVSYSKDAFPTAAVFGPTPDAELRLVTCSGPFDVSTGHYVDNLVVFAIRTL